VRRECGGEAQKPYLSPASLEFAEVAKRDRKERKDCRRISEPPKIRRPSRPAVPAGEKRISLILNQPLPPHPTCSHRSYGSYMSYRSYTLSSMPHTTSPPHTFLSLPPITPVSSQSPSFPSRRRRDAKTAGFWEASKSGRIFSLRSLRSRERSTSDERA